MADMIEKENIPGSVKTKRRLGEMLIEKGIINYSQLKEALDLQKGKGERLACILVELGIITEDGVASFYASELGLPRVLTSQLRNIDPMVKDLLPDFLVRKHLVLPLSKDENTLTVAMSDPLNVMAIDEIASRTGYKVRTSVATESDIKNAIDKHYGKTICLEDLVKKLHTDEVEVVKEEEIDDEDLSRSMKIGAEPSVVNLVNYLIIEAVKVGSSDIHIEPLEKSLSLRYRIDGILYDFPSPPKRYHLAMVSRIKILSHLDIAEHRLPQDGRFKVRYEKRNIDLRVSIIPTAFGEKVVLRILDSSALCVDLSDLGFEHEVLELYKRYINAPYGIILVTGPTGSGKSTTLYSSLKIINTREKNLLTIEDPIEYILTGVNQVQIKPEIGFDFSDGLRAFLRQDPDVIMVGEIRDRETAEVSINAALTGHLVLSSLHTNNAAGAVTRLVNMGVEPFLISSTLIMVVAQRLARIICPRCKEPYQISSQALKSIGIRMEREEITLYRGRGCNNCNNIGYRGRTGIFELMVMDEHVRENILNREPAHIIHESARSRGMMTLTEASWRKVIAGITTVEEVLRLSFEGKMIK